MASQSLCGKMGLRTAVLGSLAYLAVAAPLSNGDESMAAHTGATRIGEYYDRTGGAEKIGMVVMGSEVLSVGVAGVTAQVPLSTPASATGASGLNIGQGVAPSAPANGDVWITSAGMFARAGGVTSGPFGAGGGSIGGSIAATQVAYGSGVDTITGSTDFVFASGKLSIGAPANLPTPVSLVRTGASDSDAVGAFRGYNAENTVEFKVNLGGSISGTEPLWQNAMVIEGNRNQGLFPLLNPSNVILSAFNGAINFATASLRAVRLSVPNDGGLDWTGLATGSAPALSPANHGRIYYDSTAQNFYASTNGGAYAALGGTIAGSIAANQVAYGSGANAIQGSAGFTFTTGLLALTSSSVVTQLSLQQTTGSTNVQLNMDAGNSGSAVVQYKAASVNTWQQFSNAATMGWFDSAGAWTALALNQGTTATGSMSYLGTKAASSTTAGAFVVGDGATTATNVALGGGAIALGQQIDWTGLATVSAPALSAANHGRIYYDSTAQAFYASVNGGAYAAFGAGVTGSLTSGRVPFANGASSLTDSGTFLFSTASGLSVNRSAAARNEMFGSGAGNATLAATDVTLVGFSAGASVTTSGATGLVAVGSGAAGALTTSNRCTVAGFNAFTTATTGANDSTAFGYEALKLTTVSNNTAFGARAAAAVSTGTQNTAVGTLALNAATTTSDNTAVGCTAGVRVTGTGNTAVGSAAMQGSVTAVNNTGINNTAVGSQALLVYSSGARNSALGKSAGSLVTTGSFNIFLGESSGDSTAAAASNRMVAGSSSAAISAVYIGNGETHATPQSVTYNATGGVGSNIAGASLTIAGGISTGNAAGGSVILQTARSGVSSSTPNTLTTRLTVVEDGRIEWTGITTVNSPSVSSANNGAIFYDSTLQGFYASVNGGAYAALSAGVTGSLTSGRVPFANGAASLTDSGTFLFSTTNGLSVKRSSAVRNEMFGDSAGNTTLTATDATLIGYHAGAALTTSVGLTAVGTNAAAALTTSARCTAVGFNALATNTTGAADCTAVGYEALKVTTINSNTAVGSQACTATTNGSDMTAIGDKALKAMVNAASCTAVGSSALVLSTGGNNTAIGAFAGNLNTSGTGNTFIGESAGDATANNATSRFVAGSNTSPIATVFFGNGETNAAPQNVIFKVTGGSGANIAGASCTIAGGIGTGTGIGGSIVFQTAIAGGSSSTPNTLANALVIDQKANLVMGTAALGTTATDGFLYVASCAGAPTGVPTAFTGRVPIQIDTTNGKFWAYYGGAWHFALLT